MGKGKEKIELLKKDGKRGSPNVGRVKAVGWGGVGKQGRGAGRGRGVRRA